jgi:invasion protein IalB
MQTSTRILIACLAFACLTGSSGFAATKTQKTFDGWQVECNENDQGDKSCAVFIAFIENKSKAVVLGWTIGRDNKSEASKLVVRTLTGVDVSAGIAVQFGTSKPVNIPYKSCMPQYCAAEVPFSDAWLKAMNASPKFTVTYKAANGKDIKQEVDLSSFGAAYNFYVSQLRA